MQIHEVQPITKIKKKKRIGRGGKRGTYSGKGMKGQKSRSGAKLKPIVRDLLKRYPKLRGYQFSPLSSVFVVNISVLDKVFDDGAVIEPKAIVQKGLLGKSKRIKVKILGNGETEKKFYVKDCLVSKSAQEKIEKAGGRVPIIKEVIKKEKAVKKEKVAKEDKSVRKPKAAKKKKTTNKKK